MLVVNIAMAMVVGGGTHLYTTYHGRTQHYLLANKLIRCLRLCVAMATCNLVGKMLLTSTISMPNYSFIVFD